jgi:hypothetical protein
LVAPFLAIAICARLSERASKGARTYGKGAYRCGGDRYQAGGAGQALHDGRDTRNVSVQASSGSSRRPKSRKLETRKPYGLVVKRQGMNAASAGAKLCN